MGKPSDQRRQCQRGGTYQKPAEEVRAEIYPYAVSAYIDAKFRSLHGH